jgi:hypothetical protein
MLYFDIAVYNFVFLITKALILKIDNAARRDKNQRI